MKEGQEKTGVFTLRSLLEKQNRTKLAVVLGTAAMILLLLSELLPTNAVKAPVLAPADETAYREQLEKQLQELIEQIDGAGTTTVMITLESGEETVYATDTQSGQTQSQETHVLLEDGTGAGTDDLSAAGLRRCGRLRRRGRYPGGCTDHRACAGAAGPFRKPDRCSTAPELTGLCDAERRRSIFMRAISKNTRKATAITLAAALVVAVYLNWQYARTGVTLEEDAVNVAAAVETEEAVSAPIMDGLMTEAEAVSSANKNYGEAQLVSVANNSGSKFFEEARLKRTKAHDEAMDAVQKALKSASLSAEEKKSYTQQLTGSLEDLNAENEIETLVRAKGFADCLCFLQSGRADLTVMTSGDALTAAQVAQIRDIVLSKSNVTAQNITIVEVK